MVEMKNTFLTRYAFRAHTRRMSNIAIGALCGLVIGGGIVFLAFKNALPNGLGLLVALAGIVALVSFVVLLPLGIFLYIYSRGGFWLSEKGVHVHFPAEDEQFMDWDEALYAIDEGDEYLALSKGKEGLGHLVGRTNYVRLHLEGILPEQREEIKRTLAEHVEVRRPRMFTFATLMNLRGETVARGRVYLFEDELLLAENRGKKRVFVSAPIKKLSSVRQRNLFQVGKLECEAFALSYEKKEYVVMLGYELTLQGPLGGSSHWSATGSAEEWVAALQPVSG